MSLDFVLTFWVCCMLGVCFLSLDLDSADEIVWRLEIVANDGCFFCLSGFPALDEMQLGAHGRSNLESASQGHNPPGRN